MELMESKDFSYISVKEICEKAGVNRSTFYLHYENTSDLLSETLQYTLDSFLKYFTSDVKTTLEKIKSAPVEELIFVTEEYLIPYLEFIQNNRRIYRAAFENKIYEADKKYQGLYKHILEPILARFHVAAEERRYISAFYITGINGTVKEWVESGCVESVSEMARLIEKLVMQGNRKENNG